MNNGHDGIVLLKLFNVVARQVGGQVLSDTVRVPAQTLLACLNLLKTAGQLPGPEGIRWNGKPCPPDDIKKVIKPALLLALQVIWH